MKQSKFTPGPWKVEDECIDGYYGLEAEGYEKDYYNDEVTQANARLMSAAPDMYELLVYLHNNLPIDHSLFHSKIEDILNKANP